MSVSRADWNSSVPWRRLEVGFPIRPEHGTIAKIVAHPRGTYGWQNGDWVSNRPFGDKFHKGVDLVGWMDTKGNEHSLAKTLCLAPFDGVVEFVGSDEDEQPSIVIRHSSRGETRFRISFFGDLSALLVKDGARVVKGQPVGHPLR
jgi:murein DD-endopeptidase MepM/ murein hydrolase activator NlpD